MPTELVTPSQITPWLLAEAKDHLRVSHNEDDGYIQSLIIAVAEVAELMTNRSLFTQTWKLYLDEFPGDVGIIELPKSPIQSVTHVKYYDTSGVLTTMDSADYQLDKVSLPARLMPSPTESWPQLQAERMNAVEIQYVAGVATRGALPAGLKLAMNYHLSHCYDVREPVVIGTIAVNIPFTIATHYEQYRIRTFY